MSDPKLITVQVRVLPPAGQDNAPEPLILPSIKTTDHRDTISRNVRELLLGHRPESDIDLDGRVEITRQDGSLFSDPETVDQVIPVEHHHNYPKWSIAAQSVRMILIFKLVAAPILILGLTLLSRRYGPAVSGLLMGVPLVTGPISVFTALEHGKAFAQHAAVTNLVGQISTCLFCFSYALSTRRLGCWLSAATSIVVFFLATFIWNQVAWRFIPALAALLAAIVLMASLLKPVDVKTIARIVPRFDLPLRMIVSGLFVLLITVSTSRLGPQLSGLVAPFPVFVLILSVFTHHQMGGAAASNLARGVIVGSFSFAAFFAALCIGLVPLGLVAYAVAAGASVAVSGLAYLILRQRRHAASIRKPA